MYSFMQRSATPMAVLCHPRVKFIICIKIDRTTYKNMKNDSINWKMV